MLEILKVFPLSMHTHMIIYMVKVRLKYGKYVNIKNIDVGFIFLMLIVVNYIIIGFQSDFILNKEMD